MARVVSGRLLRIFHMFLDQDTHCDSDFDKKWIYFHRSLPKQRLLSWLTIIHDSYESLSTSLAVLYQFHGAVWATAS